MLKEVLASNAAKLVAACVCPVVGAGVALKVPEVRSAVHKATAPKPVRYARAKPKVRPPAKTESADKPDLPLQTAALCAQPLTLPTAPMELRATNMFDLPPVRIVESRVPERVYVSQATPCSSVTGIGFGTERNVGGVPEPATWAQMIAGFALVGTAVRTGRRRREGIQDRHKRVTRLS